MSRRTERVASTIQQELAQIIMRELNDPRLTGLPSITRVKVSPDLSIADVYMTIMGTEGQQTAAINALRHSAGLLRLKLTKQLTLRVAPFLKFHIDENLKREMNVLQLLQKVREENEEAERRAQQATTANPSDIAIHDGNESQMNDASAETNGSPGIGASDFGSTEAKHQ
jgi:ribosome-binding factor A